MCEYLLLLVVGCILGLLFIGIAKELDGNWRDKNG